MKKKTLQGKVLKKGGLFHFIMKVFRHSRFHVMRLNKGLWSAINKIGIITKIIEPAVKNSIALLHLLFFKMRFGRTLSNLNDRKSIAIQLESLDKGGLEEVVVALARGLRAEYNVYILLVGDNFGYLGNLLRNEGFFIIRLHRNRFILRYLIRELRIRVVSLHYSIFGLDEYRTGKVAVQYTVHNNYIWADEQFIFDRKDAYRKIDRFIAVSGQVKDFFCRKFDVATDSVGVVNNGLDLQLLEKFKHNMSRSELGLSDDDFVFINVASLNWNKFHIVMVSAMKKLIGKYPNLKLLFVGNALDENCHRYIVQKIAEYGLQDSIRLIPYVPKSKVLSLMGVSDCFIFPSLTEGWGIATTEAMYSELPLILSDIGGARDLIENDDIGIVIRNPYRDILDVGPETFSKRFTNEDHLENLSDLCRAMERIYLEREYWKESAKKGKKKILEQFNQDTMIRGYLSEFNELLKS